MSTQLRLNTPKGRPKLPDDERLQRLNVMLRPDQVQALLGIVEYDGRGTTISRVIREMVDYWLDNAPDAYL